ncbi:MIT domain-containing protein 1-like [Condylostylus longicornis]|uniref:MIT domain-containing protein 1-like n=1 Tax=Condylostylus longicornis TaxID=2530218 RepID=UPI00244E220B|nr:MIT domain-containing protein 1-like [Condylostylus longicornis]
MNAREILIKACEFDKAGRRLEAFNLYFDGIQILNDLAKAEKDEAKKQHFKAKIEEYINRAEHLKKSIQRNCTRGELVERILIMEGATGHSYKSLFGKYLTNDVKEIEIAETYLREHYQFQNLIIFLELCVKKCRNLKYVKLTTKTDPKPMSDQKKNLEAIQNSLLSKGITLAIEFSETLHDREIILNTGFIIKIGRGLHYFKAPNPKYSLGLCDFDFRECFETTADIFKCTL